MLVASGSSGELRVSHQLGKLADPAGSTPAGRSGYHSSGPMLGWSASSASPVPRARSVA